MPIETWPHDGLHISYNYTILSFREALWQSSMTQISGYSEQSKATIRSQLNSTHSDIVIQLLHVHTCMYMCTLKPKYIWNTLQQELHDSRNKKQLIYQSLLNVQCQYSHITGKYLLLVNRFTGIVQATVVEIHMQWMLLYGQLKSNKLFYGPSDICFTEL